MCNFGKQCYKKQFCELIFNLDKWLRRKCHLKMSLSYSSDSPSVQQSKTICAILVSSVMRNNSEFGPVVQEKMLFKGNCYLELWQPFCSIEWNHLCSFGRGYYKEIFCEIILNLGLWFRRRSC